jgi:hypothetical protein
LSVIISWCCSAKFCIQVSERRKIWFRLSPCFMLHTLYVFSFYPICQCLIPLHLHPLVFGVTPFGWLRSITLSPTYSIISYENIIFDLRLFIYIQFTGTQSGRKTRAWYK